MHATIRPWRQQWAAAMRYRSALRELDAFVREHADAGADTQLWDEYEQLEDAAYAAQQDAPAWVDLFWR